jgi:TonB family protein
MSYHRQLSLDNGMTIDTLPMQIVPEVSNIKPETEPALSWAEQMPIWPGCEEDDAPGAKLEDCSRIKMIEYIYIYLSYPPEAKEKGIGGAVVINFVVDKYGYVKDIAIMKDIGTGCGEAAAAAVRAMADNDIRFMPGRQSGKAVNIQYIMPINFMPND